MSQPLDTSGFVLVGGRSSRMGVDKASMLFCGVPLARYIAGRLAPVVDSVALVGDPVKHADIWVPIVADEYPGAGPLGGVITALRFTKSTWNLVTACDLPAVDASTFEAIVSRAKKSQAQCLIPVTPDGKEQVACAAYRSDCLASLVTQFNTGAKSLRAAVRALDAEYWEVPVAARFVNINTPQDFARFNAMIDATEN